MSVFLLLVLIILFSYRVFLQVKRSKINPDIKLDKDKVSVISLMLSPIFLGLMFIGILLACISSFTALTNFQKARVKQKQTVNAVVQVMGISEKSMLIKVISSDATERLSGYALNIYKTEKSEGLELGGVYQAKLALNPIVASVNPGQRAFIYNQVSKKIIGQAKIETIQLLESGDFISQARIELDEYLNNNFEHGVLLSALTTGITRNMSQSDWRLFRETGTIHLISISGLHLSIVAGWLFISLRFVCGVLNVRWLAPFMIAAVGSIVISVFYALFAGFGLPIIRALIMFSIAMLCLMFRGRLLSFNNITTALFIILIFWPLSIFQAGFWLSFLAVSCLILYARVLASPRFKHAVEPIWLSIFKVQLYLSLILLPLTAHFFGTVSVVSPLTNLLAIPFTTIFVMPPLMLGVMIRISSDSQIAHDLATVLFSASDFAMGTLRNCLVWFTRIPFHEISLKLSSIAWALLLTVVLGALCFYPKYTMLYFKHILMRSFLLFRVFLKQWSIKKRRFKIVCVQVFLLVIGGFVAIWLWLPQVNQPRVQARLIAFPSGEGLSFFIQLNDFNVLFDNGRYFRGIETAKRVILPSFEYFKVKKLDHMILSIDNNQHIGGTKTIRTAFSDVKITAHHTLTRYIDDAFDCANDEDLQKIVADYFSNHPSNLIKYTDARVHGDFAIKALPVLSSCGLDMRIGRYNIWLLSDISIKEWSYLTDLLMQKVLTVPDIILMPKQGRSRGFILSKALKEQPDLLIILSTRQVNAQLIEEINTHHINALNANDGMIILDLSKDKLQYKQDKISDRHWWLG